MGSSPSAGTATAIARACTCSVDAKTGEVPLAMHDFEGIDRRVYDCAEQANDTTCYLDSTGLMAMSTVGATRPRREDRTTILRCPSMEL